MTRFYLILGLLCLLLVGCLGQVLWPDEKYPMVRRLTKEMAEYSTPRWSPDGQRIAFRIFDGASRLFIMNKDGSDSHLLLDPGVSIGSFDWSPDGQKILYAVQGGIYVATLGGTTSPILETSDLASCVAWSPDGRHIAFCQGKRISAVETRNLQIYTMKADGTEVTQLTRPPLGNTWQVAWSPDSREILFTAEAVDAEGQVIEPGVHEQLYLMNTDGTNIRKLQGDLTGNFEPTWAPDGQHILFRFLAAMGTDSIPLGLYLINRDDTARRAVIQNIRCNSPDWSRQSNSVVFTVESSSLAGHIFSLDMSSVLAADQ